MTQEDKELLLKDLLARLLYHVKVKVSEVSYPVEFDVQMLAEIKNNNWYEYPIPYLRSMSSMTEEEKEKYHNLCYKKEREGLEFGKWATRTQYYDTIDSIDYLNSIHIDYRGLIPMGLALEAPKNMY